MDDLIVASYAEAELVMDTMPADLEDARHRARLAFLDGFAMCQNLKRQAARFANERAAS